MPRRTRRAESEVAKEGAITPEDASQTTTPGADNDAAAKPRSRSRRNTPPVNTIAEATAEASVAPSRADAGTISGAGEARPRRRRGGSGPSESGPIAGDGGIREQSAPEAGQQADSVQDSPLTRSGRSRRRRTTRNAEPGETDSAAASASGSMDALPNVSGGTGTPEGPSGSPEGQLPRRRVGGRRTPPRPVVSLEAGALPAEAEERIVAETGETGATEGPEGESRTGRRSRRGGRRRNKGGTDISPDEAATGAFEQAVDEIDLTIPEFMQETAWQAPRLVPRPADLGLDPATPLVTAKIGTGVASFEVNGASIPAQILFVNTETNDNPDLVREQIRQATAAGIQVISSVAYLPLKNARGERSFAKTDELLAQILEASPDAYILIRVQCAPTNYWVRTHPGELVSYADGSEGDVSFASEAFWTDCVMAASALLDHLSDPATPGSDHVIGIHLDKGEWFHDSQAGFDYSTPNRRAFRHWLRAKYQTAYSLRASWRDGTVDFDAADIPHAAAIGAPDKRTEPTLYLETRDHRIVDYLSYASDIVADAITGMAEAIKTLSKNALVVGVSYGYTFEFAHRNDSGHQALGRVLGSPDIDMVAGPLSYANRAAGGAGSFPGPVDSARLHNKLWVVEDDTKTHLANEDTDDPYNPKIATPVDTTSIQRRNLAAASVHNCGIAWMDLWGKGWLNSASIWSEIAAMRESCLAAARHGSLEGVPSPEVAVLVDEASYAYVRRDTAGMALQAGLITKARDLLCRSGASIGFYLQSDIPRLPESIKLYFFMNALRVTTAERHHIREYLQRSGKTLVWMYAPGLFDEKGLNPHEVSELVGMALRPQPWNSQVGTVFTEERHPIIERLHGGKRMGTEDPLNPSYTCTDPQSVVLGEYASTGLPSILARTHVGGWKSVFVGEPHVTGELLRGIFRYAGVHLYDVQDDVIYATGSTVLVHAPYSGQRTLQFPRPTSVYSFTESRLVCQQSTSFRQFMKGRSTHFFVYGQLENLASALDLSVEELKGTTAPRSSERDRNQTPVPSHAAPRSGAAPEQPDDFDHMILAGEDAPPPLDHDAPVTLIVEEIVPIPDPATLPEGLLGEAEPYDEVAAALDPGLAEPPEIQPTSPSRRRRWNRRNSARVGGADRQPAPIDDLLSDLAARRQKPSTPEG